MRIAHDIVVGERVFAHQNQNFSPASVVHSIGAERWRVEHNVDRIAGALAWLAARWSPQLPRWISLVAIGIDLVLAAMIWIGGDSGAAKIWIGEVDWNWVPSFGIHFHLAVDGLSLLMLILTFFLGIMSVLASWTEKLSWQAGPALTQASRQPATARTLPSGGRRC